MERSLVGIGSHKQSIRGMIMTFGKDFFKILSMAIAILRLFGSIFGDDATKKEVTESKERSADNNPDHLM